MALQGTLDTFALPDVLRLLAATQKTGRLRLTGPRGTGSVLVDSGNIGTIEAPAAPLAVEPVDALFELLRFEQGSFTFDADAPADAQAAPCVADLEALLAEAELLLAEWREIEGVVPSMDAWVTLRPALRAAKVSLDRGHWQTVVAVGSGATVRHISDELGLAELPASRAVRSLSELGLVDVAAEPPPGAVPTRVPRRAEPLVAAAEPAAAAEPERFVPMDLPSRKPVGSYDDSTSAVRPPADPASLDVDELVAAFPSLDTAAADALASDTPSPETVVDDESEVARQLAKLSPRAAEAVRSAANLVTDEERAAALADTGDDDDDEPINRGLLLKFLSSVKN